MNVPVSIRQVSLPLPGLDALATEARRDGHAFLDRLVDDWGSGANRFDRAGEILLGAFAGPQFVAIGGLNRDPYALDDACARLRHVYVARAMQRHGIGRALVERLIGAARHDVRRIRLRAGSAEASAFYLRIGFEPVAEPFATHVLHLRPSGPALSEPTP